MGRHRHVVNVRADGLTAVLEPFLRQRQVQAATLIDLSSGMVLDGFAVDRIRPSSNPWPRPTPSWSA